MNRILWLVQVLLAALFLFAGTMKFIMPMEEMTAVIPFPAAFLYFIGLCELLGGVGLILPWLLRIHPGLTPLAATGLVVIMLGAAVLTAVTMTLDMAAIPFVIGCLAAFVAYGRWHLTPQPRPRGARRADSAYHPI